MGHAKYLDNSYLRQDEEEIENEYLQAMPNVSVYEVATPEFSGIEKENADLKNRILMMEQRFEKFTKILQELKKETLG